MPLDLSGLTPYQPSGGTGGTGIAMPPVNAAPAAPTSLGGFNVSGLKPYNSETYAPPADTPTATTAPAPAAPADTTSFNAAPERTPSWQDVLSQAGYGLVSGIPHAAEGTADMLEKDTMQGFSNPVTGENLFSQLARDLGLSSAPAPAPAPYEPQSGTLIKKALGPVNPDNYLPAPQSAPERVARAVGEGIPLMLAPEAGVGELPTLGKIAGAAFNGAVSGGASQLATEAAPDNLKPVAGMVGAVAGALGADALATGAGKAVQGVKDLAAPLTKGGQEGMAGDVLAKAATDPQAAVAAIDNAPRELVPGSVPTTGQLTGDMGLLGLERAAAAKNPELFNGLRADQNAARLDALANVQADGHAEAVSDFFRSQLNDIDQRTQALYDQAHQTAQTATDNIGGTQAPDVAGNQLRSALDAQLTAQKAQESGLWRAVDPTGTLNVVTSPLKRSVQSIYGDMGQAAQLGVTPIERGLAAVVNGYGPTIPFRELTDVRSQISQAMRDAKSPLQPNDVAYGRLSQLREAVENAISDSVQGKAAEEQQAVASGALAPENTIGGRMLAESKDWLAGRAQATARANGTDGAPDNGVAGPIAVSSPHGTEVSSGSGPRGGSSPSGLPQDAGSGPLVDQAAADRLAAATRATAARKQTFGAKPVANILKRPGPSYPYDMAPENIAAQVWHKGPQGAAAIGTVLRAANNAPEAIDAIRTGAAASLRKAASLPDGSIDPQKFNAWKAAHSEALGALEKAAPKSTVPYEDAAKAGANLQLIAKQRKDAIDAFQKSEAGKLLGLFDPADVTKTIGSIFGRKDAVKAMKEIAGRASGNPDAEQGLRKAIVDFMGNKLISNTEAAASGKNLIKSDQFQTFLTHNFTALRQVFSDAELNSMRAIAADLKRANRSITAVKLPGASNTAQDLSAIGRHTVQPTILNKLLEFGALGGGGVGTLIGGGLESGLTGAMMGAAAGQVAHWLGNMRAAGIANVNELVRDAMLDPDLAKTLLMKASKRAGAGSDLTFGQKLQRMALQGAAIASGARQRQATPTSGDNSNN